MEGLGNTQEGSRGEGTSSSVVRDESRVPAGMRKRTERYRRELQNHEMAWGAWWKNRFWVRGIHSGQKEGRRSPLPSDKNPRLDPVPIYRF